MNSRFTDKAQAAIGKARAAAASLQHGYVGTEHLLIGLLQEKESVASMCLEANGVEEEKLISLVSQLITPASSISTWEIGRYSSRARYVLENSVREADRFQSQQIGTEHILIAILKDTDCVAARLLNTMHIQISKLYNDLLAAMGEDSNSHLAMLMLADSKWDALKEWIEFDRDSLLNAIDLEDVIEDYMSNNV